MRRYLGILAGIFLAVSPILTAQVTVREIRMNIPTYIMGPDDPAPPFLNHRIYPYPMQTDLTRTKVLKSHRVVVLENEYIRVLILPDLGGRILAAHDKTNRDFDFIYHNRVVKPGLVALRGAWLSGGIEWNFPTLGHTVDTVSPVKYEIMKDTDGSVTCVVGTEEWVRRMKWEVFITVSPGLSRFTTRIRLENRTLTHANGYFWANAATHAWDDTRVIFPPTDYVFAGGRSRPSPWPIVDGRDVSWVKNTPDPKDYFCATPGDFNAAYNYDRDNGTAHWADRHESPGKKFWTWGTAPGGAIWESLLTDADGQYIEIQSGRLPTQGDTWIFEPLQREEWREWWYPLKNMGGLVTAVPEAALNFEVRDNGVFVALNATQKISNATLVLSRDGQPVFSEKVDLDPAGSFRKDIALSRTDGLFRVKLLDVADIPLMDYSNEKPALPDPELQPDITGNAPQTAQNVYLQGYYSLKRWDAESAMVFFRKAIELDPDHGPALRWLGILYYQTGRTAEALKLFDRCLMRDEDDHAARYYRALSQKRLGIKDRIEQDLALLMRRPPYQQAAGFVLASLQAADGDYSRARETLGSAILKNPQMPKPRILYAALERRLGLKDQAEHELAAVIDDDRLDSLVRIELHFLTGAQTLDILRDDPEYYLEAASDYADFGLYEDAVRTIEVYLDRPQAHPGPMLFYDWGYYCQKLGRSEEAQKHFARTAAGALDYAFPFRTESEDVLRAALRSDPSDWKARYLLGTLLAAEYRSEEALAEFKKAAEQSPAWAMLYRNTAELLWKKAGRIPEAAAMYERAVSLDQDNFRLYGALDELYSLTGDVAARDRLFRLAPAAVRRNFNIVLGRAQYLVETGDQAQALKLLKENTFLPWEGWTSAHQVWVQANVRQALSLIKRKDFRRAKSHLEEAKEYPSNLGTGRPSRPSTILQDYYLGVCCRQTGEAALAEKYFQTVLSVPAGGEPETRYYQALAIKALGRETEALDLLSSMKKDADLILGGSGGQKGGAAYQAALACLGLGEAGQAEGFYRQAVRLDPSLRWKSLFSLEIKPVKE